VMRKAAEGGSKAVEKPSKSRGIKELNDAPPLERGKPGLLAYLDWQLVSGRVACVAAAGKGLCARGHAAFLAATPRTQAVLEAHSHERWLQACFALLLLLALGVAHQCPLPPSVGQLASSRWIEVPLGLALALKFNEIGGQVAASCTPTAVRHA